MTNNEKKIEDYKTFWNVEKAVKRLIWRLSPKENGKYFSFEPNKDDFNALKSILGDLDRQKKINLPNNVLFAKLYIYILTQNIRFYETTALNDYPNKDLAKMLNTPLDYFYQAFYNDLHNNQFNKLLKSESKENDLEILKEFEELKKTFTLELITSKLDNMINESLKKYSYPKK